MSKKILDDEYIALFDVDVEGGLAIRKNFGSQILDVFVMPPSVDELHKRLVARATETADSLSKRLEKAEKELHYAVRFNNVIVNIDLETSINDAKSLVQQFLDDVIPDPEEEN